MEGRMPNNNTTFAGVVTYKGQGDTVGHCGIIVSKKGLDAHVAVIQLQKSTGTSVTNAAEDVGKYIMNALLPSVPPDRIRAFEVSEYRLKDGDDPDLYRVVYEFSRGEIVGVKWQSRENIHPAEADAIAELIRSNWHAIEAGKQRVELND